MTLTGRSHTVFTVVVAQRDRNSEETITGRLNLIDLAGGLRVLLLLGMCLCMSGFC